MSGWTWKQCHRRPVDRRGGPTTRQVFTGRLICALADLHKKRDWRVSRPLTRLTGSVWTHTERCCYPLHKCNHCGHVGERIEKHKKQINLCRIHQLTHHVSGHTLSRTFHLRPSLVRSWLTGCQVVLKSRCITMLMCGGWQLTLKSY